MNNNNIILSYNEFEKYMEKLKQIEKLDENLHKVMTELTESICGWTNSRSIDLIMTLLEHLTNDTSEIIRYYICELDWGEKWEKGTITTKEGKDIPLETIEDLYNYLLKY